MKSYTDIIQSKKLAEILPIESADMWYSYYGNPKYNHTIAYEGEQWFLCQIRNSSHDIPCWSLSALLELIPNFNMFKRTIECKIETTNHLVDKVCEPLDAAFEMIVWLKENKKI